MTDNKVIRFPRDLWPKFRGIEGNENISVQITLGPESARRINALIWMLGDPGEELYHISDQLDEIYGRPTPDELEITEEMIVFDNQDEEG